MKEVAGLAGTVPVRQALQDRGTGNDEGGDESLGRNWALTSTQNILPFLLLS